MKKVQKMNSRNWWWRLVAGAGLPLLLAGCFGSISYKQNADPFGTTTPPALASLPRPLPVMVLPVSVQKGIGASSAVIDATFTTSLWKALVAAVDDDPATFSRLPLPAGGEADEVIRKTMQQQAGLLPPEEFAKVKGFALPERFLYGNVVLEAITRRQLRGADQTSWKATAVIRLVNGNDFSCIPLIGTAEAPQPSEASRQAMVSALVKAKK